MQNCPVPFSSFFHVGNTGSNPVGDAIPAEENPQGFLNQAFFSDLATRTRLAATIIGNAGHSRWENSGINPSNNRIIKIIGINSKY
jgi:hypothetical protein